MPATAVLIPTTRPAESASAPPELPGLSAASVWITSSTTRPARPLRVGSERPSALTTPAVTDPARPSGLPTATTSWPDHQRVRVAQPHRRRQVAGPVGAQHREVRQRVGAHHAHRRLHAVEEVRTPAAGVADHVRVGHQHAVRRGPPRPSRCPGRSGPRPPGGVTSAATALTVRE